MNEHYPITAGDGRALATFFATAGRAQRSPSGGEIEFLQTYGVPALEDYWRQRAENREKRAELVEAGANPASLPWDLTEEMGRSRAEITDEDKRLYQDLTKYTPDMDQNVTRGFVSARLRRMAAAGQHAAWIPLEIYFGPIGVEYRDVPLPQVFSLMHVTRAGREFLERAQSLLPQSPGKVAAYVRMRWHCQAFEQAKYDPLRELRAAAELQADKLYREAAAGWNQARGGS